MTPWTATALAIAVVALSWAALSAGGAERWRRRSAGLLQRLEAVRRAPMPASYDARRELEGLPEPVQRYFRAVLTDGAPIVAAARVEHRGRFDMGQASEAWKPFTSRQRIVASPPGFVWDASVSMLRGVPVRVHDAYVAREGLLQAALLGLVTVAEQRGSGDIALGATSSR